MQEKLKVLDLFSGIGMFSYGLEQTGLYETVAFCEKDEKCQQVLTKHWPEVYQFNDVKSLEYQEGVLLETDTDLNQSVVYTVPDIICGGFPCQDISNSGNKSGLKGDRSSLWFSFLRLIKEVKPKGVLIENVSSLKFRGLTEILEGLNKIGYDAEWHCIPVDYFGEVHKRDRLFILAYSTKFRPQGSWKPLDALYTKKGFNRKTGISKYVLQGGTLPYLCGEHDGSAGRVDRLKQLGNTIYWPIVEQLGYHMHKVLTQ